MDSKGRALDNVFTERLWRSVKYEEVYLHDYASPREVRHGLSRYFTFYHQERLYQALGYATGVLVHSEMREARPCVDWSFANTPIFEDRKGITVSHLEDQKIVLTVGSTLQIPFVH